MAQGYLIGLPQRLWTSNGTQPAVGWKIETYEAGGSTPLTTYSNGTLTTENTNPIVTDANGYFRMFVAAGVLVKLVVLDDLDAEQYTLDNLEPMVDPTIPDPDVTAVPTGGCIFWPNAAALPGSVGDWLACDGSAVSRATFSDLNDLYAAMSPPYPFGNGNGTTTFNVPNMTGRFALHQASSGTGDDVGETGGSLDHTHTGPSHTHGVTVTRDGWGQTLNAPSVSGRVNTGFAAGTGQFNSSYQATGDLALTSAAGGTGNTGSSNPAFLVLGVWIVKT